MRNNILVSNKKRKKRDFPTFKHGEPLNWREVFAFATIFAAIISALVIGLSSFFAWIYTFVM